MKFESSNPKETQETKDFEMKTLNKMIKNSTDKFNFLISSFIGEGKGKDDAQNVLDKIRERKDELQKQQKADFQTFRELEPEVQELAGKMEEIFQITGGKDPAQLTEEDFKNRLDDRMSALTKNLEDNKSRLASLE